MKEPLTMVLHGKKFNTYSSLTGRVLSHILNFQTTSCSTRNYHFLTIMCSAHNFLTIMCSAHNFHIISFIHVIYGRYSLYKLVGELLLVRLPNLNIKIEGLKIFKKNFPHPPAKQRRITS